MATGTQTEVVMPQMGVSVSEGTVTRWLKQVGDTVVLDEPLLEISTDKVDTEVPSPGEGIVLQILVEEGATVDVGTVLALIAPAGAEPAAQPTPETPPEPETQVAADAAATTPSVEDEIPQSGPAQSGPTQGGLLAPPETRDTSVSAPDTAVSVPAALSPPAAAAAPPQTIEAHHAGNGRSFVSPVVARIAAKHGVDPGRVPGTGTGGRVTKKDILKFIESGAAASEPVAAEPVAAEPVAAEPVAAEPVAAEPVAAEPVAAEPVAAEPVAAEPVGAEPEPTEPEPAAVPAAAPISAEPAPATASPPPPPRPASIPTAPAPPAARPEPAPVGQVSVVPGETVEPMTAMRRGVMEHMRRSLDTSAHVTSAIEVDMSKVVAIRERLKAEYQKTYGVNPTYLAFIARATVDTLKDYPWVNAEIRGESIVTRQFVNLGIAVALADGKGLIVPVIRHAEDLNLLGMARQIADVAERARTKKLLPDDVQGGTFTITNPGGFGTFHGTPIISQPQVGILGTYALVKRPWVVQDELGHDVIAIRPMMNITLTYDHRLVDGAYGGQFLHDLRERLESWAE